MSADDLVSDWIVQLEGGDSRAAQKLWEHYFQRLLGLARQKLGCMPRRWADEEDIVLSAFSSFWRGAQEGRFPQLRDRQDLWRLLVTITERKVNDQRKYSRRQKRGGGKVRGESGFLKPDGSLDELAIDQVCGNEPTPEFVTSMLEEFERLLGQLEDETLREVALLKLEGYTNREIAQRMECTTRSVERKLQGIRTLWCHASRKWTND